MSDRFDHTLERKLETNPDGEEEPRGIRRIELITGPQRRREWSHDEKMRILLESAEPGANISEVARRNGLSPQQLFGWRREARTLLADATPVVEMPRHKLRHPGKGSRAKRKDGSPGGPVPSFAPVVLVAPAAGPPPSPPSSSEPPGVIEIVIGETTVRILGAVDARTLEAVLAAVRRSS